MSDLVSSLHLRTVVNRQEIYDIYNFFCFLFLFATRNDCYALIRQSSLQVNKIRQTKYTEQTKMEEENLDDIWFRMKRRWR